MEATTLSGRTAVVRAPVRRALNATGLTAVCVLAAALRLSAFDRVLPTPYYDAAVRSMGLSWHNFFFGAFEPGGQVSLDKTPVDLWLQVASTQLFGFSSTSLRLPQAIAGTLAVPLLYDLVRRGFGRGAGLAAAAALAALPVAVLTSRSDTMDTVMGTLLLAAAWIIVRARAGSGRGAIVAAGVVAGLAFEVKLFQAAVALPALAVMAWMALDAPVARRVRSLALGALAFIATAMAWPLAASLAPGSRPWPIGSTDGSIWNVIFVFNGIDRLGPPASGAPVPGVLRLFDASSPLRLGVLAGGELTIALVAGAIALALGLGTTRRRAGAARGEDERRRLVLAAGLGTWLATGTVLFSLTGQVRPRYLEAMTPAIAGVLGIGLAVLAARAGRSRASLLGLAACAGVAAVTGPLIARATGVPVTVSAVATVLAAAPLCALALRGRADRRGVLAGAAAALILVAALAVPVATSARLVRAGAGDSGVAGRMPAARVDALCAFLRSRQGGARYELASSTVTKAAPLIVRDARPVLMLTSLHGRPLLTARQLAAKVRAGEVRYALIGRARCSAAATTQPGCAPVVQWARRHGIDVSREAGFPARGALYQLGRSR